MKRGAGFSIIELLIVMAIIMILSALSVPFLLNAQQHAREAVAVGLLRSVSVEQERYRLAHDEYGDQLSELIESNEGATPVTPPTGGEGGSPGTGKPGASAPGASAADVVVRSQYIFRLTRLEADRWKCTAEPVRNRVEGRYFYVDQSGVIRYHNGGPADDQSPAI